MSQNLSAILCCSRISPSLPKPQHLGLLCAPPVPALCFSQRGLHRHRNAWGWLWLQWCWDTAVYPCERVWCGTRRGERALTWRPCKRKANRSWAFVALQEQLLKYQLKAITGAWGGSVQQETSRAGRRVAIIIITPHTFPYLTFGFYCVQPAADSFLPCNIVPNWDTWSS